jgi:signal transduction histidine kinase
MRRSRTVQKKSLAQFIHPFYTVKTLHDRLNWSINIRWLFIFGLLISVPLGRDLFNFHLAYHSIIALTLILLLINLGYFFMLRYIRFGSEGQELLFSEVQVLADLALVSFLIHYAGGIDNPFFIFYLLEVIHSAILFPGRILPYLNAVLASALLTVWTWLEYSGSVLTYALRPEPPSISIIIITLTAFYVTCFFGVYIINNFMLRYIGLKLLIDEKNRQLEKAINDRGRVFRFTAHELKAPISTIKSTLEVVRKLYGKELKPEIFDMIRRAEGRSDQVLDIIKDMIEITHYNMGLEKPNYEETDYGEWLFQIITSHQSYAATKNINLFVTPLRKKILLSFDKNSLEKILNNLVNNALRYTPEGGNILVEPIYDREHFGFAVRDSGIGIASEDIPKIFDEFYRTKEAREMERIGTGLGLNLVQQIVKSNGGTIKVDSEPGRGSVFTVNFPLQQTSKSA